MPLAFFRIVTTNPPTSADFMSYEALGIRPLRDDAEALRLATGVSVYATAGQAKRRARSMPWLGGFIATVGILEEGPIRYERTDRRRGGHNSLWGESADLLACVVSVEPV